MNYNYPKECEKIIKEVTLLSRLHHIYIVRYFQAWTEEVDVFSDDGEMEEEIEEGKLESYNNNTLFDYNDNSNNRNVEFYDSGSKFKNINPSLNVCFEDESF